MNNAVVLFAVLLALLIVTSVAAQFAINGMVDTLFNTAGHLTKDLD